MFGGQRIKGCYGKIRNSDKLIERTCPLFTVDDKCKTDIKCISRMTKKGGKIQRRTLLCHKNPDQRYRKSCIETAVYFKPIVLYYAL